MTGERALADAPGGRRGPGHHRFARALFRAQPCRREGMAGHTETVELPGGGWLFRQGDPGDSLYFLIRGRLQVWRVADDADAAQARRAAWRSGGRRERRRSRLADRPWPQRGRACYPRQPAGAGGSRRVRADVRPQPGVDTEAGRQRRRSPAAEYFGRAPPAAGRSRPSRSWRWIARCGSIPSVAALVDGLAGEGRVLDVHREGLAAVGAPGPALDATQALDEELKHWLQRAGVRLPLPGLPLRPVGDALVPFLFAPGRSGAVGRRGRQRSRAASWESQLAGDEQLQTGSHQALVLLAAGGSAARSAARWPGSSHAGWISICMSAPIARTTCSGWCASFRVAPTAWCWAPAPRAASRTWASIAPWSRRAFRWIGWAARASAPSWPPRLPMTGRPSTPSAWPAAPLSRASRSPTTPFRWFRC